MSEPHKCPVCEGSGKRQVRVDLSHNLEMVTCHACDGTGVVWSGKSPRGALEEFQRSRLSILRGLRDSEGGPR